MNIDFKHGVRLGTFVGMALTTVLLTSRHAEAAKAPASGMLAVCDNATALLAGAPVSADIDAAGDVHVYLFALAGASNEVSVSVSDPTNERQLQIFGDCDLTGGPGSGDPIDGVWTGQEQVATFSVGAGVYYASVRAKSGRQGCPLHYTISLDLN